MQTQQPPPTTLTTDLQILRALSQQHPDYLDPYSNILTLNTLNNLLTNKNATYSYSNQQRENDQGWVRSKRVDVRGLISRVRELGDGDAEEGKADRSYFYVSSRDLEDQSAYIEKNLEYSMFASVQRALTSGIAWNMPINKRKKQKKFDFSIPNPNNLFLPTQKSPKNTLKSQSYLKSIQLSFQSYPSSPSSPVTPQKIINKCIEAFKSTTKLKIWEILYNLIPVTDKRKLGNQGLVLSQVAILALRMVQSEINLALPSNYQSILCYLENNYLRKLAGKYQVQGSLGPIWGVAYLLYKAGRRQEFYQYVPDASLRNMFKFVDQSIQNEQPEKLQQAEQNGDVFHDQLIYALSGQSKYSSQHLCDPNTLDLSWTLLRTVGIFPSSSQKFLQLQQDLSKSYKVTSLSETKIKNLLYLLCFDYLVEIGCNQLMDQEDFLHFLVVLYHSGFRGLCWNLERLEKKLTERLAEFIQPLLVEDKKQALYYIALTPLPNLPKQLSTILTSTKKLQSLHWPSLQQLLPAATYHQLISQTCTKYVEVYQSYILAAEKVYELLGDWDNCIRYVVKMFVRNLLRGGAGNGGSGGQGREIGRGLRLVEGIFSNNQRAKIEYETVFQFFKQHNQLLVLLQKRNQQKLHNFLKQTKHILLTQNLRLPTKHLLQKLTQIQDSNGFDCYIQYMIDIVKGYEIALTKMGKIYDLQELQRMTLQAYRGLMAGGADGGFGRYAGRELGELLGRVLEEGLYRYR